MKRFLIVTMCSAPGGVGGVQGSFQTSIRKAWQQIGNQICFDNKVEIGRTIQIMSKSCAISFWEPHCCTTSERIRMNSHGTLCKSHLWRGSISFLCHDAFYLMKQAKPCIFSWQVGMLSLWYYPLERSTDQYGAFQHVPLHCCIHGVKQQLLMLSDGLLKPLVQGPIEQTWLAQSH